MSVSTRVDLTLLGIRGRPPVSRTAGAGPSADGHLIIDGRAATVPLNPLSPFVFDGSRVLLDGEDAGLDVEVIDRPRFYDLQTAEGVSYDKIARLHGRNVLATTVVQTCIRYDADQRCRFCSIEESLRSGATTAVKRPHELAEVAAAAVRLDGVRADGDDHRHLGRKRPRRKASGALCAERSRPPCQGCPSRCNASHPLTWRY